MVYVRSHNFSTQSCKIFCPGALPSPREHTRSEYTIGVVKDRPDQPTALRTGCSNHCDYSFANHCDLLLALGGYTDGMSQSVVTIRSVRDMSFMLACPEFVAA